jgi:hypothetical protein
MSARTEFSGGVEPLAVFIGHDGRETDATRVCEASLREHSSMPLHIQRLHEPALRHIGMFSRNWRVFNGQKFDMKDEKPFSTNFSFTRFLVPSLMQHSGWALFCDSDFLFFHDVAAISADPRFAVQVVKHAPLDERGVKMDGQAQQPYFRKNWSSLVLWNCGHPSNQRITPREVNGMSGQWLHSFSWLDDSEIGELPAAWNHLVGVDKPLPKGVVPAAAHFTLGTPDFPDRETQPYADHWRDVLARL